MGQGASVAEKGQDQAVNQHMYSGTKAELLNKLNQRCLKQFTQPELVSFKEKTMLESFDDLVPEEDVYKLLYLNGAPVNLKRVIHNFLLSFTNFPFISENSKSVTGFALLKATCLLKNERCIRYLGTKNYRRVTLVYIALKSHDINNSEEDGYIYNLKDLLQNFDDIDPNLVSLKASDLLQFLTWMLLMSIKCSTNNCQINTNTLYDDWNTYKQVAFNLLRSMNPEIISNPDNQFVSYLEFQNTIFAVMPSILQPLENITEHLLYTESCLVEHQYIDPKFVESKVMKVATIAQLSTALRKEVILSKLQKLYVGRESGFSMRSLQAKVFKWNAPTVMVICGMRIVNDVEYFEKKNPRYKKFLEEFPKLRDVDQTLDSCHMNKRKVLFAVYMDKPWKVTNKGFFGGLNTAIIELSPRQDIFKSVQPETTYFSTIGGGIGVGNKQPRVKSNSTHYSPGNVSLTINNTLEFAVFRHTGYGGNIGPSLLLSMDNKENIPFEIRFLIQDVDVWGCGGEQELEEQLKQWQWEEAESQRRQRVNLKSLGEDRAILEMAGIIGQHNQSGGSV